MTASRRHLLGALALSPGFTRAGRAQSARITIDILRDTAAVHGKSLSDDRLRIIQPALERRLTELQALRALDIDDSVGLTQGILAE